MQTRKWFLLMIGLLLSFQVAADDEGKEWLRKADAHYAAGRYDIAVGYYLKAAEFDETEAQFNLGYALFNGEGIKQDYSSAVMWFKRAANKQYPKAEYNLAFCYMYGKGVPCDYEKAQTLLMASANHGLADAQITLAECYEHGILVEQDLAESRRWKDLAAGKNSVVLDNSEDMLSSTATYDVHLDGVLHERSGLEKLRKALYTMAERSESAVPARKPLVVYAPGQGPAKSAPMLKILFPTNQATFHTDMVKVKYQLQADGQEASTPVTVMVDGVKTNAKAGAQANTLEVAVPNRDCTITLYAENQNGKSKAATVQLVRDNMAETGEARLFCLAIGTGGAAKGARDFARVVEKKQGSPYAEIQMKVLTDREATRADITEAIEWLQQETNPNDVCLLYYVGDGYRDVKDCFYFLPYGSAYNKLFNALSAKEFKELVSHVHCKLMLMSDVTCKVDAGNYISTTSHYAKQLQGASKGMLIYASSSEEPKNALFRANSTFTKALLAAFNDKARQGAEKSLSTKALGSYLLKDVQRNTSSNQATVFLNPDQIQPYDIFTYEN